MGLRWRVHVKNINEVDFLSPRRIVNERKVLRTCSEGRSTAAVGGFEKEDGKKVD